MLKNNNNTAGSSTNILIWQQKMCKKKAHLIFSAIEDVFETKIKMREESKISEEDCFKR